MPPDSDQFGFEEANRETKSSFEEFLSQNKVPLAGLLIGVIFLGFSIFLYMQGAFESSDKIEVLSEVETTPAEANKIIVEISGAVQSPGVYALNENSRVEELLIVSGGLSADADREWVQKYVNRAAKLIDGQKLYIYKVGEQSQGTSANNSGGIKPDQGVLGSDMSKVININTASLSELESLPGIGPAYGQSIIEHRPYSDTRELVSKDAVRQSVYDKIKDLVSVY